jgi:UDP-glucose 4-epimerase
MKFLVTGAGGFVGRRLVERLSARHEVCALVRDARQVAAGGRVSVVAADLARPLDASMLPARADVIIHLAQANVAFPEEADELFAVNTSAAQQLLGYGRRAGARRFLLASSGDVYGRRAGLCRESDAPAPADFYGLTKYAAELVAESYGDYLETCALRLFRPYGEGQTNRLIPKLAERIRRGEPVRLNRGDRPLMTPTHIEDVTEAFERAALASFTGALNVAGDELVSLRELARLVGEVLATSPVFEETGNEAASDMAGDNARMKRTLGGWPLVTLDEGLRRTLA